MSARVKREKRTAASWAKARDAALERDNYACQGSEFGLRHICLGGNHVHHLRTRALGGTDDLDNLLTVCLAAHDLIHRNPARSYELGLLKRRSAA